MPFTIDDREPTTGLPSPYGSRVFSQLLRSYQDLYEAERQKQREDFADLMRRWNYEMGARNMIGSGPWVEGTQRRVSDFLEKLYGRQAQLSSDLLSRLRGFQQYETGAQQSIASTLANVYGTRGIMSTLSDIMKMGALPRTIEEANINAILSDLFYRLGLGSRIAGGFGQPYITTREVVEQASPLPYVQGGLTAFGLGLYDYLSRLYGGG